MKGHIVINGLEIPVTDIAMRGGKIHLTCAVAGPLAPVSGTATLTVFGEDGTGVCQTDCAELDWPSVRQGDVMGVHLALRVDSFYESIQAV